GAWRVRIPGVAVTMAAMAEAVAAQTAAVRESEAVTAIATLAEQVLEAGCPTAAVIVGGGSRCSACGGGRGSLDRVREAVSGNCERDAEGYQTTDEYLHK